MWRWRQTPRRSRAREHVLSRARSSERGAVIFIVASTLAVLAAMGVFALTTARNEIRTSGYQRQSLQTHYLSEYGVLGASQTVNASTAQLYLGLMMHPSRRDSNCISLPNVNLQSTTVANTTKACRRMGAAEIHNTGHWLVQSTLDDHSFGYKVPIGGDFFIEMTDPTQSQAPPGYDLRLGLCFVRFTVSSVGITQPKSVKGETIPPESLYGGQGLEMARARITAGPVRCAK